MENRDDMTAEKTTTAFGWRICGLSMMALGNSLLCVWELRPGQPVPRNLPLATPSTIAAGAFMELAAVVILMNGRLLLTDYAVFVTYENIAMQLTIAAGGLIVYATTARIDAAPAARLTRLGRLAFGICAPAFGGAHFVYMNHTASLVPKWLLPTQEFWGYATAMASSRRALRS
jgi:hypothetical protein